MHDIILSVLFYNCKVILFNIIYLTLLTYKVKCLIIIFQAELGFADFHPGSFPNPPLYAPTLQ